MTGRDGLRLRPLALALAALACACAAPAGAAGRTVTLPPAGARWDYQLGGAYEPPAGVRIVERDRSARPAPGRYGICYVNAFQTQPGETDWWRRHHPELLLRDRAGREVGDPGWPGEVLLDVRTPGHRSAIADVERPWLAGCRRSGFAAVELDNLDLAERSPGLVRAEQSLAFAALLVRAAHRLGLAVAQKNAADLVGRARRIGFDFAVTEQCQRYAECAAFERGYGRHVLEVEYADEGRGPLTSACRDHGRRISVVWRDRQLVVRGAPGYRYAHC